MHTFRSSRSVTPLLECIDRPPLTYSLAGIEAGRIVTMHPLTISAKYRNIHLLPIGYAFRPDLRTD